VVAEWAGAELVHDPALEERIWAVVSRLRRRMPFEEEAMRAGARKQALVPVGAAVLEPVGTAPGLLVPSSGPLVGVLPGPPRELQTMWDAAVTTSPLRELLESAGSLEQRILRFFPLPEPQIAATLREIGDVPFEVTTCLRRGELEVATVFPPGEAAAYSSFEAELRARHGDVLFSDDGATIDEVIARLLLSGGLTIATAESCTGGLMAGRLTDLAGSSAYVLGGLTVYSNEAKTALAGVPAPLIEAHGAVSPEVATALSAGARARLGADIGIGITGIAGPGGGSEAKPVGTVCISVSSASDAEERTVRLPGGRADIRDRTTTVTLHMLRALLLRA
jgi:nicotinamide-nucleotide amidase